jgi:hypothetical protein
VRSAVSTPRVVHSPCSSHAAPAGREAISRNPFGGRVGAGRGERIGSAVGVGFAEVAVDRAHQPAQPVGVESILPPEVEQHVGLRRRADPLVVGQGEVAHDRAVLIRPRGRPQVHDRTRSHHQQPTQADMTENVCPHFRAPRQIRSTLTSHYSLMCPSTAERGISTRPQSALRPTGAILRPLRGNRHGALLREYVHVAHSPWAP